MSYRGVYRDGIIILHGEVDLQNGDSVIVDPAPPVRKGAAKVTDKRRARKTDKSAGSGERSQHPFLALAGLWKDRPDWHGRSSIEVVEQLRRRPDAPPTSKRPRRG